jgi:hypothetical protein
MADSSNRFPPSFYRVAAIASFASVITTLLLTFLPDLFVQGSDFETRMRRVTESAYILRSWSYLLHPIVTFAAALAVAMRLRARPALVLPGLIGFAIWAIVEVGQQMMTLFMYDPWRRAWLAGDEAIRATMEVRHALYDGLWDASFYFLLFGFLIGSAFYAAAMIRVGGFSRVVGAFYAAVALLTLWSFVVALGGPELPALLDRWAYPAVQPLGRVLIGLWLWRNADEGKPIGASLRDRP